jgi:hypothetical protein
MTDSDRSGAPSHFGTKSRRHERVTAPTRRRRAARSAGSNGPRRPRGPRPGDARAGCGPNRRADSMPSRRWRRSGPARSSDLARGLAGLQRDEAPPSMDPHPLSLSLALRRSQAAASAPPFRPRPPPLPPGIKLRPRLDFRLSRPTRRSESGVQVSDSGPARRARDSEGVTRMVANSDT